MKLDITASSNVQISCLNNDVDTSLAKAKPVSDHSMLLTGFREKMSNRIVADSSEKHTTGEEDSASMTSRICNGLGHYADAYELWKLGAQNTLIIFGGEESNVDARSV
jgi:hypothetical protein